MESGDNSLDDEAKAYQKMLEQLGWAVTEVDKLYLSSISRNDGAIRKQMATNSKSSDEGSTSSDHTAWMSPAESSHTVASEEFQEVLMENFSYKDRGASGEKDGFILEKLRGLIFLGVGVFTAIMLCTHERGKGHGQEHNLDKKRMTS